MNRIQGTLTAIGVAMLVTLGVSCGGDPTPEPDVPTSPPPASAPGVTTAPPVPSTGEATTAPPAPAPASASRAPGATSVKEFAFGWPRGGADVIVVATISSVLAEKLLGPYGEDGTALPADEETSWPVTDYLVQIESVLKADDVVVAGADTLVLRMFGYLSRQGQGPAGGPTFSVSFELPKPGDHLLFVLRRNPDGTYGSGPAGLLNIDGATVAFVDGFRFPFEMAPAQFMDEIRDEASRLAALDPGLLEPLLGRWKGVLGPSGREAENITLREAENMETHELLEEGLELISFEFWIEQDGVHGFNVTSGRWSELVDLRFELPIVHFESSGSGTVFDGELEGDTISGTATLRGQSSPFSLERNKFPSAGGDRR